MNVVKNSVIFMLKGILFCAMIATVLGLLFGVIYLYNYLVNLQSIMGWILVALLSIFLGGVFASGIEYDDNVKGECKMENVDYNNVENSIKNLENKDLVLAYKEQHGGDSILKNVTDGYHTFDELYYHRMVLSKLVFEVYKQYAWKSWLHSDGTMFEGSFIVGVSIPGIGDYSYHYDAQYFDFFDVPEVDRAPEYDGHTPDNVKRLLGLKNAE